jgi:two-component system response regulator RegA
MLVVDDDDAYRTRLCRALRDRGFDVEAARSVTEATALARTFRPDRAVLDLRLGDGSGVDLLTGLLALDPTLQCLVLTGYGSIATAVEAVRRGAIDYLTKPLDADEILLAFESRASGAAGAAAAAASSGKAPGGLGSTSRAPCGGASGSGRPASAAPDITVPTLHRVEWEHIQRVLADCGGNISEAARQLGMHRRTLQRKLATRPPDK